ncbi:MAG TPA: TonB-dependent receptor plug domain-containing protein [Candidatus Paceibacterota bacterium]|nr:TonB-dependent receptor plug domain-containing protein [Verrucomicrobiota bacterium]HRY49544.1 TonB-dependent receptor plug domain-containing protein [Candidatus Paceibacterota bacterium]
MQTALAYPKFLVGEIAFSLNGYFLRLGFGILLHPGVFTTVARADAEWLDLEQWSKIRIITASKKEDPLSDTAAAVSVVTREDLQRTWATSVPEAVRYVPGVEAAQINSHDWVLTVPGLNGSYANQLLVLQDGRSIVCDAGLLPQSFVLKAP